jgi:hypothetical protein
MRVSLPAIVIHLAFQQASFFMNLSNKCWKSALFSLLSESGRPRYQQGKCSILHWATAAKMEMSSGGQAMGRILLFARFVFRPEACPNSSRMANVTCKSAGSGLKNITISSA